MEKNKDKIKVSVMCLAYNHCKYIRKALDGFVSQKTNFLYEVLIHDDASTDGTQEIIREYEKKYPNLIKPIYQTENQYSQHIPIGKIFQYPRAQGDYLAFCEGDDYWTDPNKLQKQYDIMCSNPDVSLCVHTVQCRNEDDSFNEKIFPEEKIGLKNSKKLSQDEFAKILFSYGYAFHTSSYFIRKDVIDYNVLSVLTMNGDQKVMRSALLKGNIYYINEIMSHRRLFTKGNYNERFVAASDDYKIKHYLSVVKGEIAFDRLSNGKYHKLVNSRVYGLLLSLPIQYGIKKTRKQINAIIKTYKYCFGYHKKFDLLYVLYRAFPYLYVPVRKIISK